MSITWEEMKIKYPEGRNTMSEEREKTYVNECFNCYEQEGFAKKFWSPFSDYKEHFGQSFEVIDAYFSKKIGTNYQDIDKLWNARIER